MQRFTRLVRCLGTTLVFTFTAHAAERVKLQHISFNQLQQMTQIILPDKPQPTRIIATNALRFMSQHTDNRQITHLRMQQEYAGFPVFGGNVVLHRRAQQILSLNGSIYQGLQDELGQPEPTFVSQGKIVLEQFITQYKPDEVKIKQVIPMVYIDEQAHAFWAYKVNAFIEPTDAPPSRPSAIIAANTGHYLESWNDLKTIRTLVKGAGFGGNQHMGKYQFGVDKPLLDISRDDLLGQCYMENKEVKVVDMLSSYGMNLAPMMFDCGAVQDEQSYWTGYQENGYDLRNGGYSPSNDALYIGKLIKEMYSQRYGVEALMNSTKPMQLVMRVHYGRQFSNAFWDGFAMTFGDGDGSIHPLVSLDIGAHEVSHGFTEQHSNLAYFGESGGINESFSDMAAQAAEYYVKGYCSWQIGADIIKKETLGKAFRFMDRPSRDGYSIDRADQYLKGIDVHYSSGVYNRLFYLLSNQMNWDPSKAFQVMLKANMDYWIPKSTFIDGACGVLYAAEDLGFSLSDVKRSLDLVRIDYDEC